jgi:uncharacterized protein
MDLRKLFNPYNPWWEKASTQIPLFPQLPSFRRPIFYNLCSELQSIPQMLSVTGPRRIGKSTLLLQLVQQLLESGVSPSKLLYYSFDDPALATSRVDVSDLIDHAMRQIAKTTDDKPTYLFLDEIQKLDRWELYLKKYYDLHYPIKVVISGSASSPIFKRSRESLLGRVKDYHLLPFSFREFVLYRLRKKPEMIAELEEVYATGNRFQEMLTEAPGVAQSAIDVTLPSDPLQTELDALLLDYFLEGGFPEVWDLLTWIAKQDYLYDNQVKKVIYEDLVLAAEFRKPELLKRFYISLLERPGQELAVQSVSQETAINAQQIEKYIPLLEMTDLVYRLPKFRSGPLRVRRGMMKFYLVDLALRNAALRLTHTLLKDDATLGLYAENLVFLALRKWRGKFQMDYYRDRGNEIDFIVHLGPRQYLPVEVKYRNTYDHNVSGFESFHKKQKPINTPIVVTKKWEHFGLFGQTNPVFLLPLPLFLLMFD